MKPYVYKLKEPFAYENKKYDEVSLNFTALKGKDMIAIEDEMEALGKSYLGPEFSAEFAGRLAARAANMSFEVLIEFPYRDYSGISSAVRNFMLFGAVDAQTAQKNTSDQEETGRQSEETGQQSEENPAPEDSHSG